MTGRDDNLLIPLMMEILDAQRTLIKDVVSQEAAPRLSAPVLHTVPVRSAAGLDVDSMQAMEGRCVRRARSR